MKEIVEALESGKSGWDLVEAMRERIVAAGLSTEEHYRRHFEGEDAETVPVTRCPGTHEHRRIPYKSPRLMDSLQHYLNWKAEHPGQQTPPGVNRIRTDRQHAVWAGQGFPPPEREIVFCETCAIHTRPAEQRDAFGGR